MLIKLINIKSVPKIGCSNLVYSFLQQEQFAETKSSSLTSNSAFVILWQESHKEIMYVSHALVYEDSTRMRECANKKRTRICKHSCKKVFH